MSKIVWRDKIKKAIKSKALEDLLEVQYTYSKGEHLVYGSLQMRSYFKSNAISTEQAKLIFKIRTRMINVKNNYRHSYQDLTCPLKCKEMDIQEHLLINCDKMTFNISKKEYDNFMGQNDEDMVDAIKKVEVIVKDHFQLLVQKQESSFE